MNNRIKELYKQAYSVDLDINDFVLDDKEEKFAQLVVQECARKTVRDLMTDPALVRAMDEHYEKKWAHRFD